jgi:hypothetical protein
MKKATAISCVFLDIGCVMPADGWDQLARKTDPRTFAIHGKRQSGRDHPAFFRCKSEANCAVSNPT